MGASINFTGSVPIFQWQWKSVGENLQNYSGFPKLIGECGGKNYHFVHPTAEVETVVASTIRSAFEYSGQKCSACSRVYAPESLWPQISLGLIEIQKSLKIGSATDADSSHLEERAYPGPTTRLEVPTTFSSGRAP